MLQYAIADANENILGETDLKLAVEIEQLPYGREFTISRKVCSLLEVINMFYDSLFYDHIGLNVQVFFFIKNDCRQ